MFDLMSKKPRAAGLSAVFAMLLVAAGCEGSSTGEDNLFPVSSAPDAPINVVIDEGDTVVTFTFDAATTGDTATRFTATCEATGETTVSAYSGKSPVTLTGMVNGVTYTCSLIASNTEGAAPDAGPFTVTPATGFETTDCSTKTTDGDSLSCLSRNLLDGLTTAQRSLALLEFSEANAVASWNINAVTTSGRAGVAITNLDDDSVANLKLLLQAAFSDEGYDREEAIRIADGILGQTSTAYGDDFYYFSFLGEPTYVDPWMLVFTGHNYTVIASVDGDFVSVTPNFVGSEPASFTADSVDYAPLEDRRTALVDMLAGLDTTELATADLGETFTSILLGPGDDGDFPATPEGLQLSGLTAAQRDLVKAAIATFSDDQKGELLTAGYMTAAALDDTYISWSTDETLAAEGAYVRIDGPAVWIEFLVTAGVATTDLQHQSMWRDKTLDYGGNFDFTD